MARTNSCGGSNARPAVYANSRPSPDKAIAGHVTLSKGERSALAELATQIL